MCGHPCLFPKFHFSKLNVICFHERKGVLATRTPAGCFGGQPSSAHFHCAMPEPVVAPVVMGAWRCWGSAVRVLCLYGQTHTRHARTRARMPPSGHARAHACTAS